MIQHRDVTSLVPTCKFQAHSKYITRVLLSPDVRHLATCSADHTAKIWAVDPNAAAVGFGSPVMSAQADPKGVVTKPGELQEPPAEMAFPLETTLTAHQRWVWDCAFSADSAYLVTACSDHYARLWELSSRSIIRQYSGHHRGAVCVALNDYSER
jgi:G protein beta subunit-like protein